MHRHCRADIRQNVPLSPQYNLLTLALPDDALLPSPGQFYMIGVSRGNDPLLKRAFSLFRLMGRDLQILFRVHGRGTELLRAAPEGTPVDLLGPLGNFYPLPPDERLPIVIAGGIGIASVFSLVQKLDGRAVVFYGARTGDELLFLDEIRSRSRELHVSTDDGSAGEQGMVTEALQRFLASRGSSSSCCIYACGPRPMLKEVSRVAEENRITAYVSLEEHMACGIGACLGCAVRVKPREYVFDESAVYQRVCKEGPIFDSREIEW